MVIWICRGDAVKRRVAILISGRGSNMAALTDAGPIVMQGAVAVADDDTAETLAERILGIEHRIYPEALRLLANGTVRLEGDICRISGPASPDRTLIWPAVDKASTG